MQVQDLSGSRQDSPGSVTRTANLYLKDLLGSFPAKHFACNVPGKTFLLAIFPAKLATFACNVPDQNILRGSFPANFFRL